MTLVGAPYADNLRKAIEELRKTSHRGEPADEVAGIQADKAILSKDIHGIARQDKSSSLHVARASQKRRYSGL